MIVLPGQPQPAAWAGQGLATPYINGQGELELVYADSRGIVRLGGGKGQVTMGALAPDRQQLVYVTGEAEAQRIYYVNALSGSIDERELIEARDSWPVGRLAWSPCSQYLAVDSGTSAAVRPLLLLKPATGEVIGSCQAFGFAWSPTTPSRLAMAQITSRPLMPVTELDRTTDLVLVDLPSGRLTRLAQGGVTDCWGPVEWTTDGGLKADHSFMDYRQNAGTTETVSVPGRLPAADSTAAAGTGPLPASMTVHAEIDFQAQLLLVDSQGVVQRKLTDAEDGRVFDVASSADGTLVAYIWWAKGDPVVQIKAVRLPEMRVADIPLALSATDRRDLAEEAGPHQLAFAPQGHLLLANFYGQWRPDDRVQVYDVDSGKLLLDQHLWLPLWAPGQRTSPVLVAGALLNAGADPAGLGVELSLIQIDVAAGTTTMIRESSETESWWPLGFADPSRLRCLRVTTDPAAGPTKVEETVVTLPE